MDNQPLPLLRLGVLHMVGSFFNLDEERLLNNTFTLTSERIEKNALSFYQNISPTESKRDEDGWMILCSSLGITKEDLMPKKNMKKNMSPQSYVKNVWLKVLNAQGLNMRIIKQVSGYGIYVEHPRLKEAYEHSMLRYTESPKSNSPAPYKKKPAFIFSNSLFEEFAQIDIAKTLDMDGRVLFLTPDADTAKKFVPFLFKLGVTYENFGTSSLISKNNRINNDLHNRDCLLLSATFFPVKYLMEKFDLVILYDLDDILKNLHVATPLPNFLQMSVQDKRKHKPMYYKNLWKVADIFHLVRHYIQESSVVISNENNHHSFLERVRGEVKKL